MGRQRDVASPSGVHGLRPRDRRRGAATRRSLSPGREGGGPSRVQRRRPRDRNLREVRGVSGRPPREPFVGYSSRPTAGEEAGTAPRDGPINGGEDEHDGALVVSSPNIYGLVDHARLQRVEHDASYGNPAHVGT